MTTLVLEEPAEVQIISEGIQGPPGPRGLPGSGTGTSKLVNANGDTIQAFRMIARDSAGIAVLASADNPQHANRLIGMSASFASTGEQFELVNNEEVEFASWQWEVNKPVWLGLSGLLTQTPPSALNSSFCLVVGFASSASSVFVRIGTPIIFS